MAPQQRTTGQSRTRATLVQVDHMKDPEGTPGLQCQWLMCLAAGRGQHPPSPVPTWAKVPISYRCDAAFDAASDPVIGAWECASGRLRKAPRYACALCKRHHAPGRRLKVQPAHYLVLSKLSHSSPLL